jgi:hypothetical protein
MEPKKQKTPHSLSYETESSAVPLIFAALRRTFFGNLHFPCFNAAIRTHLLVGGRSVYQLGSDVTGKVPTMRFHQMRTLCKLSFSGVLRHRFSTLNIIASFRLFVNIFLKNDEKMSGNTDLTAFFQN